MQRIDLSIRQLEAFAEIVEKGGFRAAAASLGLSQPALSRTVLLTEQVLGARLFDRTTQGTELTPAGRELLPIATRILGEFSASRSELAEFLHGRSGRVDVAVLPSIGVAVIPPLLARFQAECPEVRVSLQSLSAGALQDAVLSGRSDMGLSVPPRAGESLEFQPLMSDPFVLLCRRSDPLARHRMVPWSVFADHRFIATGPLSSIRVTTDSVFAQAELSVQPLYESGNVTVTAALVAAGLGITALPSLALRLVDRSGLVTRPLVAPEVSRRIGLLTRSGRTPSVAAERLRDLVLSDAAGAI